MSSFTKPISSKKLPNGERELLVEFTYFIGSEDSGEKIVVTKGFVSDGASIPRFLWSIVGHPWGEYEQSAWLHDYICREKLYARKKCDQIMRDSMVVLKVKKWKRFMIYRGLRTFGWAHTLIGKLKKRK